MSTVSKVPSTCSSNWRGARRSTSPHSAWKDPKGLDAMIGPLWGEKDEAKRIAGYKAVSKYIADEALVIPLFQYSQTVVYRKGLKFRSEEHTSELQSH